VALATIDGHVYEVGDSGVEFTIQSISKAFVFALALDLGGTLSGEHGVGVLKRPYLESALGPVSIEIQRRIKHALDPQNILNPGKMFPQ